MFKTNMMNKEERQNEILYYLQTHHQILITTICKLFSVVPMTARRDLAQLEEQGLVIRTHGGAILKEKLVRDTQTPFEKRLRIHQKEKRTLCLQALKQIQPHDTLFLGSGTTISLFASLLTQHQGRIWTNSIHIASQFSFPDLCLLGGPVRQLAQATSGLQALPHHIDKAFIGVNAIGENGQLYSDSVVEKQLLERLPQVCSHIYVLCDSTKLKKTDWVSIDLVDYQLIF